MDGARAASLLQRGYGIAASKLGLPHDVYRPLALSNPLVPSARVETVPAALDPKPTFRFSGSANYGQPVRGVLVDGSRVRVGDYLVGASGTSFIAAVEHLQPVMGVVCNAVVTLLRGAPAPAVGAQPYGHDTRAIETEILSGWPASLMIRSRGAEGEEQIPGGMPTPEGQLLLPVLPAGVVVNSGDAVMDDLGRRSTVLSSELTALGWRCSIRLLTGG